MSELKPCPNILKSDLSLLNDRILNLGTGLATMPENGTIQVNKAFLTAILGYMEELLGMRRAQPVSQPLTMKEESYQNVNDAAAQLESQQAQLAEARRQRDEAVKRVEYLSSMNGQGFNW